MMTSKIDIHWLQSRHAGDIARLAMALTGEIMQRTDAGQFDIDSAATETLCREFLESGRYRVAGAWAGDDLIGFVSVCESCSLYAGGRFGIVQEFYVQPAWRSRAVGAGLLQALVECARQQQWLRLELCTPPLPAFERTVAFYRANGFERTGGYKMKLLLETPVAA